MNGDLAGQRFGRLLALAHVRTDSHGNAYWQCRCDCGTEKPVRAAHLRSGDTTSCGCLHREQLSKHTWRTGRKPLPLAAGQRFGRLVLLEPAESGSGHACWRCRCDCGAETITAGSLLVSGTTQSCGCLHREVITRHGHAKPKSPTYNSWSGMIQRTTNPKHPRWPDWGGRGISACDRWRDFGNFLADMGERPPGTTLDRIDNDGDYEPGNCRWASSVQQSANKRPVNRAD